MQISVSRSIQYLKGQITFREPKSQKSRRLVALSPSTCVVLREHRAAQECLRESLKLPPIADSEAVFSRWDGTPFLPDSITHAWMRLVRKCELIGIRLHDARHTHATLMLKQGRTPKDSSGTPRSFQYQYHARHLLKRHAWATASGS